MITRRHFVSLAAALPIVVDSTEQVTVADFINYDLWADYIVVRVCPWSYMLIVRKIAR